MAKQSGKSNDKKSSKSKSGKSNRFTNEKVLTKAVVVRPARNPLLTGLLKGLTN